MVFAEQLAVAWADVDAPQHQDLTIHRCQECDEIAAYFAGKPWQELTNVNELRYHADALFLFSNAAFHYYLPAFMCATLDNPDAADLIPDKIVFTFESEFGASSRNRLELFSPRQLKLVGEFFTILAERGIEDLHDVQTVAELLRGV